MMIDDDVVNEIGELAERLDAALFSYQNMPQLPAHIHLEGLSGTVREVRNELARLYKVTGGDETLNLDAK